MIQRMTVGLRMGTMVQNIEVYCDDINLVSTNVNDLMEVNKAVEMFEDASGATRLC